MHLIRYQKERANIAISENFRDFFSFLQAGGYSTHPNFVKSPLAPEDGSTLSIPLSFRQLLNYPDEGVPVAFRDRVVRKRRRQFDACGR